MVDPQRTLAAKLAPYVTAQPQASEAPRPHPGDLQLTAGAIPEMNRVLHALLQDSEPVTDDDLFHVLREFMRVGLNCAQVRAQYLPQKWNEHSGIPELSAAAHTIGMNAVTRAWKTMIANPFSDAPLKIRFLLAKCNIVSIAEEFFRLGILIGQPNISNVDRLAWHYLHAVMWAAENFDFVRFRIIKLVRLRNPFAGTYLPPSAPSLNELHFRRQPFGEAFVTSGLPQPDTLHLPDEADLATAPPTTPQVIATRNANGQLLEQVFGTPEPLDLGPTIDDISWQEYTLAEIPEVKAVGPLINPHKLGTLRMLNTLSEDDLCGICQGGFIDHEPWTDYCVRLLVCPHLLHVECLNGLVNGAYFDQSYVRCPLCRADICKSRQVRAIEEDGASEDESEYESGDE